MADNKSAHAWISEHLKRLREETKDWPTWMKRRMKPPKDGKSDD